MEAAEGFLNLLAPDVPRIGPVGTPNWSQLMAKLSTQVIKSHHLSDPDLVDADDIKLLAALVADRINHYQDEAEINR